MTSRYHLPHPREREVLKYGAVVVVIVAAAIVVSRFAPDLGLAKPGDAPRAVVANVAAVERTHTEDSGFQAFSEALRVAAASRHWCPVRNTADGRVLRTSDGALDAYSAYREAWQAELEGAWDPVTLGDRVYWRATHPQIALPAGDEPVTSEQVREAARASAREYLSQALDQAGTSSE